MNRIFVMKISEPQGLSLFGEIFQLFDEGKKGIRLESKFETKISSGHVMEFKGSEHITLQMSTREKREHWTRKKARPI